ncbi:MAG TPA: YggS family pyridoxal phosphate-dependent enzyme [Bacteroidales bacterium]|nr:YggS family pyridoxal phosphate-dependent enzyme [Bacteroidales bacterium]
MSVAENLKNILRSIPNNVKLVAVTKTQPPEVIMEAYEAGHKIFGENRAQELRSKYFLLPSDIQWHYIGHLQSNKVKLVGKIASMIQSIDSLSLLQDVNDYAQKNQRIIPCLLQFHIATEETKFGLNWEEAIHLVETMNRVKMENVSICGVMGIATFTEDKNLIRKEFKQLREYFEKLKQLYFSQQKSFCEISMGMSNDYQIAIEEGSTIIRLGTAIFGPRI